MATYRDGYGPDKYHFSVSQAKMGNVDSETDAQAVIDQFKKLSNSATAQYQTHLREAALAEESKAQSELAQKVANAESRQRLLSKIRI